MLTDSRLGLQGSSLADAAAGTTGFNPPKREVRNALQELNQAKAQRKTFSKTKQPELAFVAKHYTGTSGHDCPSPSLALPPSLPALSLLLSWH